MRISDWSSDVCSSDLGFRGRIHCTHGSVALCGLLLLDSGYLQEEDAKYAARKGYSKHKEPRPIYTADDSRRSLKPLKGPDYGRDTQVASVVKLRFHHTGHIQGAAHGSLAVQGPRRHLSGEQDG